MMGGKVIESMFFVMLVFLAYSSPSVYGFQICQSTFLLGTNVVCDDDAYCCGKYKNECCKSLFPLDSDSPSGPQNQTMVELVTMFIIFMAFTCCCVCCYRCCCRRTTSRGFVYTTPGATTAVSVTLPPQQHQQVPYPTVVPYPQQTPYPPQYNPPTNPYYGMPPPAYGVAVQSDHHQQASAPSAPYMG